MQQWDVAHLGDDCEVLAQVMEPDSRDIHTIDDDLPSCSLQHPEEAVGEGGLAGPGAAHNPNLWKQIFRPAGRVEENRAGALLLVWWASLPLLHSTSPLPPPLLWEGVWSWLYLAALQPHILLGQGLSPHLLVLCAIPTGSFAGLSAPRTARGPVLAAAMNLAPPAVWLMQAEATECQHTQAWQ